MARSGNIRRRHIATLERRLRFVQGRIDARGEKDTGGSWDKSERSALEYAITMLRRLIDQPDVDETQEARETKQADSQASKNKDGEKEKAS